MKKTLASLTILASLFFFVPYSNAASGITRDVATVGANSSTSTTLTWNHTVSGTNTLLVVYVWIFAVSGSGFPATTNSVTYDGISMTEGTAALTANTSRQDYLYVFYLVGAPTGTHSVVVTNSGMPPSYHSWGMSVSYDGVSQTGNPEASANAGTESSSNSLSTNITTLSNNAWLVGAGWEGNGGTWTGTGKFIALLNYSGSTDSSNASQTFDSNGGVGTAGTYSAGFTTTNSNPLSLVVLSLKPAPAVLSVLPFNLVWW